MGEETAMLTSTQTYWNFTDFHNNDNGTTVVSTNGVLLADGRNPFILPWWQQLLFIIPFVAMFIVAVFGNFIVIWIVLAHKRMRTVTNYFLVNLAFADALISLLNTLFNTVYLLYSNWPFGMNYCKFCMFISPCTISASVFTFVAIALDRYMAIIHPLKPRWPERAVIGIIIGIWITSIGLTLPNLIYARTHTFQYKDGIPRTVCYLEWPDGVYKTTDFIYNVVLLILNYFLPMIILAIAYIIVGIHLWHSRSIGEKTPRQIESVKSKRKVVKMLIIVVVIFGICWLPMHVYFLLTNTFPNIIEYPYIQQVYLVIYWMAMSNSMYNPIIYCWMNTRFRKGFKYVFRWCPFVTWGSKDSLVHIGGTTVRQSWGGKESKLERNGSTMQTLDESFDETSYYNWPHGHHRHPRDGRYSGIEENSM